MGGLWTCHFTSRARGSVCPCLALDIFVWCCHCLLFRLAPDISESWQIFRLAAVCLDIFFLPDISLSTSSSDDGAVSPSGLRLSSLNLDNLFLVDNLGAFSLFSSFPYSLHCYFPSVSYFLQFSTLFTSPPFNYLRLMTFLLSSPLYRLDNLDIFIFFISLLFLHPYSPHISASLHRYSLVISIFFTSLYSLLLYSLHISTFFTSLHSWHLYFYFLCYISV